MAFYTLEATNGSEVLQMKTPMTAAQAYKRTIELRGKGYTDIVAINMTTGRRISEVQRLLRDLDA